MAVVKVKCAQCDKEFEAFSRRSMYCSNDCKRLAWAEKQRQQQRRRCRGSCGYSFPGKDLNADGVCANCVGDQWRATVLSKWPVVVPA